MSHHLHITRKAVTEQGSVETPVEKPVKKVRTKKAPAKKAPTRSTRKVATRKPVAK